MQLDDIQEGVLSLSFTTAGDPEDTLVDLVRETRYVVLSPNLYVIRKVILNGSRMLG